MAITGIPVLAGVPAVASDFFWRVHFAYDKEKVGFPMVTVYSASLCCFVVKIYNFFIF